MDTNLSKLSDSEIIVQVKELVRKERETKQDLIRHLAEVERRRLYLSLGYNSLFDYLTRGLQFSPSSAMRRIKAARAGIEVPEVFECLERGEMSLSTVEVFSGLLKEENSEVLLNEFRGKSLEEVQEIAATLNPVSKRLLRDRIEPVFVGSKDDSRQVGLDFTGEKKLEENSDLFRTVVTAEKRYEVSFSVDEEFMKLLKRAQELAFRGEKEDLALEKVFGNALSEFLARRCPKERERRRQERKAKRLAKIENKAFDHNNIGEPRVENALGSKGTEEPRVENILENKGFEELRVAIPEEQGVAAPERHIPVEVRDEVLARDNHQCSFVSESGVACCSRTNLEIDHILPFALGGKPESSNLRVLCRAHNLLTAKQAFGETYVQHRINQRDRHQAIGQRKQIKRKSKQGWGRIP